MHLVKEKEYIHEFSNYSHLYSFLQMQHMLVVGVGGWI